KPVHFYLQLPDLLVELGLQFLVRLRRRALAVRKNLRRALQQLLLPVRHQVGMNLVMRGDLLNRPLPFNRLQRNLRLPIVAVLPARSLHSASSRRQRFYTLEACPNFGEHFSLPPPRYGLDEQSCTVCQPTARSLRRGASRRGIHAHR